MIESGCLICGSKEYNEISHYFEPDQYELSIGINKIDYWRKWVRCKKCGFHYSKYSRDENIINEIYKSKYRSSDAQWRKESTEDLFKWVISLPYEKSETKQRVCWIKNQLQRVWYSGFCERNKNIKKLLDIGGATGVFAYEFQDEDWISSIVDPSESGVFLKEKYGINYIASYYSSDLIKEEFDLIALVFILEHLKDPLSFLNSLKENMNKNSLIFIEVPDSLNFKHRSFDDDIFNSCHLWMFDPGSLMSLLKSIGIDIFCVQREKVIRGYHTIKLLGGMQ